MDQFVDKFSGVPPRNACVDHLTLNYSGREKARQRVCLQSGEEITISLKRGSVMRNGDYLMTEAGRYVLVQASPEPVSTITTDGNLVQIAYHLGNRHVSLQVEQGWVRYQRDHVLDDMVNGLGGTIHHELAPFEPEGGAYGHDHH